jgi:hypothetical protein
MVFRLLVVVVDTPESQLEITIVPLGVGVAVAAVGTAVVCVLVQKVLLMAYLDLLVEMDGTQTTVLLVAVVGQAVLVVQQLRLQLLVLVA